MTVPTPPGTRLDPKCRLPLPHVPLPRPRRRLPAAARPAAARRRYGVHGRRRRLRERRGAGRRADPDHRVRRRLGGPDPRRLLRPDPRRGGHRRRRRGGLHRPLRQRRAQDRSPRASPTWRTSSTAPSSATRGRSPGPGCSCPGSPRDQAKALVADVKKTKGCRAVDGESFGTPATGSVCTTPDGTEAAYRGLFTDAWFSCSVTAKDLDEPTLLEQAGQWCVSTATAAEARLNLPRSGATVCHPRTCLLQMTATGAVRATGRHAWRTPGIATSPPSTKPRGGGPSPARTPSPATSGPPRRPPRRRTPGPGPAGRG